LDTLSLHDALPISVDQRGLREEDAVERLHRIFPDRSLYQRTGVRARREGTLFQLFSMAQSNSPLLDKAVLMLLMADLVAYFLTGAAVQEYTLATTTGMYDAEARDWSRDIVVGARIPPTIMPEIVAPGTVVGPLLDSVAAECGLGQIPVIASAGHGMAAAVAAVPDAAEGWAVISGGHRNQIAVELSAPLVNDAAFAADCSNMGGVDGTVRLLKDVPGMGPLEECALQWSREDGTPHSLDDLLRLGAEAGPAARALDLRDPRFSTEQDFPALFRAMLAEAGAPGAATATRGGLVAAYLAGLVLAQAEAVRQLADVTQRSFGCVYFLGRGAASPFLCQCLADALNMPVRSGHAEAKAVGNILMQMLALGDIASLAEGRELAARSFPVTD
jgi:rhamnulokinase